MRIRTLRYNPCLFACVTISVVLSLHLTAAAQICSTGVCVTTWQQDTGVPDIGAGNVYRTGENLMESALTAPFNSPGFGKICSTDNAQGAQLDGQVYAQPLVLTNTTISTHPVVYVVTQKDTLYAFDGTNCTRLNSYAFLQHPPMTGQSAVPCGAFPSGN